MGSGLLIHSDEENLVFGRIVNLWSVKQAQHSESVELESSSSDRLSFYST